MQPMGRVVVEWAWGVVVRPLLTSFSHAILVLSDVFIGSPMIFHWKGPGN